MTFGVLIVGLGRIGMGYDLDLDPSKHIYTHSRAFSTHPAFFLAGGVDPDAERRATFEHSYRCAAYAGVDAALAAQQPDVVVIASPTQLHGETLSHVLSRSHPKVVLCEKPLSYDVNEARWMTQACAANGTALYANYVRRSDPGAVEIKRRLDDGRIATPVKGVAWYSKGFQHNGSHFFNLLEHWLGAVEGARVVAPGRLWENADPEPDVSVSFARGSIIFLAAREEAFSHYTIELLAPNGRIRYDRGGEEIEWQAVEPDSRLKDHAVLSTEIEPIESGMDRYQWHVADQLAAALGGREHWLCSGDEALSTLERIHSLMDQR